MTADTSAPEDPGPEQAAAAVGMGFVAHDNRNREAAIDGFARADRYQFQHLDEEQAREASVAYVDALWEKDRVEDSCRDESGNIDPEMLREADWTPVRNAFERRAEVADIDSEYAAKSTEGWKQHKLGGDYWTPLMRAQMHELRAALQDPDYPHKPRYGTSGFGPEPVRYVLGVELHDMRRFEEAYDVMVGYFQRIHRGRNGETSTDSTW